jgi:hypothetical protein
MRILKKVQLLGFMFLLVSSTLASAEPLMAGLSPARIKEIAAMLPEKPAGFGPPCSNRAAWGPVSSLFRSDSDRAEKLIAKPLPPWNDDAYLEFSIKGTRPRGEEMLRNHDGQLSTLVLAECATMRGRFLPRIAEQLDAISAQRSWTLPAHDNKPLTNYKGTRYFVELNSASLGHTVAEALYLLGDSIPAATRQRAMAAMEVHVFGPMRRSYSGDHPDWWIKADSNWNAVCLNGTTAAALTLLPDRNDRALFAAAGEAFSGGYLGSYKDSGYAEEGIGYWSYGFSNYEELREQLWLSTSGKIDLFSLPKARKAALFGFQFAMLPGVYADFADARFETKPDPVLLYRINHIFGLPFFPPDAPVPPAAFTGTVQVAALMAFPLASTISSGSSSSYEELIGPRTFYEDAAVLVDRPAPGGTFAITIKGGGNGGHSHNDIGSFSIGLGQGQIVGDPGGPTAYTAETFGSKRFESKLLSSYGHPVPMIGGNLQLEATKVPPPPEKVDFTPDQDSLTLDLTEAYKVAQLKKVTRTMRYTRSGGGSVEMIDQFDLTGPAEIVESLPTHGTCRQIDATTIEFAYSGQQMTVKFTAPVAISLTQEAVEEYGDPFNRVAVHLQLAGSGTVRMEFQKAP